MPWASHLDGASHLGALEVGTAAEAAPQFPSESPNGTPIVAQPAPLIQIGSKEIIIALAAAAITWLVLTQLKK